jgi:integrase/recombinase XerC
MSAKLRVVRRTAKPVLSLGGEAEISRYRGRLVGEEDLSGATVRNYLSDLRQFAAFCEASWEEAEAGGPFDPSGVTTPVITLYRAHLKNVVELKPATINRHLVSIKRYFSWALDEGIVVRDPAKAVRLVPRVVPPPRHLTDREEAALVGAVERYGSLRDRALIVVGLHTGLRAGELCKLAPSDVRLHKRSGYVAVYGKRGKYREVPLNSTARGALSEALAGLPEGATCLFPSRKQREGGEFGAITERALGYVVAKYATMARVEDVSPHDLRHRFGYEMARRNVPLHRLAQIMGHDSLDTTMVYVRGTRADLQEAVEGIAWA